MSRHVLVLLFGVMCASTAGLFIKESTVHPAMLGGWRLILASIILSPLFFMKVRQFREAWTLRHLRRGLPPAKVPGGMPNGSPRP